MRTRLGVPRRGGAAGSNNGPPPLGFSTAGRQSAQSLAVGRLIIVILEVGYIYIYIYVGYFLVMSLRRCALSTEIITEVLGGRKLGAH